MPRKALDIYMNDIIGDYEAGFSEKALAESWGVSRSVIRRLLLKAGIKPRNRSAAMFQRVAKLDTAGRKAMTRSANAAARGRKVPIKELEKRARTAEQRQTFGTPGEIAFAKKLEARGIDIRMQQAIGPYNCDIGAEPVAVEILGGGWHWYGRRKSKLLRKIRYLLDHGWHILMIAVEERRHPLTDTSADYAAAYIKKMSSDPAAGREYRMIRGAGELITEGRAEDDEITLVPTFTAGRNALGRYCKIPR